MAIRYNFAEAMESKPPHVAAAGAASLLTRWHTDAAVREVHRPMHLWPVA